MKQLTEEQKVFIDRNYDQFSPRQISQKLLAGSEIVRSYMHEKGYPLLSRPPVQVLNNEQEKYVRDNCSKMTINKMSIILGVNYALVKKICDKESLAVVKQVKEYQVKPVIKHWPYTPKRKLVRPPAVYSNTNWQQHFDNL